MVQATTRMGVFRWDSNPHLRTPRGRRSAIKLRNKGCSVTHHAQLGPSLLGRATTLEGSSHAIRWEVPRPVVDRMGLEPTLT